MYYKYHIICIILLSNLLVADDSLKNLAHIQKTSPEKNCQTNEMSIFKDVNLTTDQVGKIKSFRQQLRDKSPIETKDSPFIKFTHNGIFDKSAYLNIANQRATQKNQATAEYFEKIYDILTPEQKSKIRNMQLEK